MTEYLFVEREVLSSASTTITRVAGPFREAKAERKLYEHAHDEWSHHALPGERKRVDSPVVTDLEPNGEGYRFIVDDAIVYRFRLVAA